MKVIGLTVWSNQPDGFSQFITNNYLKFKKNIMLKKSVISRKMHKNLLGLYVHIRYN